MAVTGKAAAEAPLVTLTFAFTDIAGSTALWEHEAERMRPALQRHDQLLAAAIAGHRGKVFKTMGDAFCATFEQPADAVAAACEIQRRLQAETWPTSAPLRVRIALHTGPAHASGGDYFGTTLNRCARLLGVARGGQTLLSAATAGVLETALPEGVSLLDHGLHRLRDLPRPIHVFQLQHPELTGGLVDAGGELAGASKVTGQSLARFNPSELFDIPTLPAVVMQAMEVLQDPMSDAESVQGVISRDPAISAKILRVANSAFFGFARRVGTIAEAVGVLGFVNVQGMILGLGAFDSIRTDRLKLGGLWRHSVTTAAAARLLAERLGRRPDEAFTAGILHDIGKLIFAVQAGSDYQRVIDLERVAGASSLEAERTLLEFTHPEVGEMVAQRWNLPPRYVAAIAHHHAPAAAGDETTFCALIGLANQAAHAFAEAPAPLAPAREAERLAHLELLGLDLADWLECLGQLTRAHSEIDAFVSAVQ
ncbi:MAG: HDOD domain-containing protein [Opitutaceae bacterium]|nr:HDOD domain-containing protein [Opitutaceae bacterium]